MRILRRGFGRRSHFGAVAGVDPGQPIAFSIARDVTPGFRYGTPSDVTPTGATAGLVSPINEPLVVRVVKVALAAIRFELFRQASLRVCGERSDELA